ncbi:MAG TPA: two-component regulator propeller domain-containing protein, partial [Telluria sp.]
MLGFTEGRRASAARAVLGWMLGAVLAGACGMAGAAAPRSLRFEHLGLEQGLSHESVLNVLQDKRGFMWFGTQAGLNRFDGYRVTVFRNDPADPGSIVDNYVSASFEDAKGRLWFGTKGGLTQYQQATGKFVRYMPLEAGRPLARNNSVTAIVGDAGGLWLATGDGLKRFDSDTGRFTVFRNDRSDPGSLSDDRVNALALDARGGLWVGTGDGLDWLAPGATRFQHYDLAQPGEVLHNTVHALSMGPRNTLWVGTAAGLQAWHLGEGAPRRRLLGAAQGMGASRILALYHDAGANLWVGTELEGLKWHDPAADRFVTYRHAPLDRHSLADNQIGSVWVDRTGTLWAGTGFAGVSRVDLASGGFSRIGEAPGQPGSGLGVRNSKVRAIAEAGGGRLWIGTTGGGLALFDPASGNVLQQMRNDPQRPGSLPDDVVAALATANGRLWVGTPRGLWWRDPAGGAFKPLALGDDSNTNYIHRVLPARAGGLWIGTRGGLYALGADGRTVRSWRHRPGDPSSLGDDYVFGLLEDRRGALWIGTENGLDRFDPASGKFTHFRHDPANPASLRHSRVYFLAESRSGDLWVGTAGGLHRVETGPGGEIGFRFFPLSKVQAALPIGAVLEDAHGMLWVSTTVGISRLDPASGQFKAYTARDGLIDGSYFVGAALAGADGQMHFGGVHGMTSFMPDAIRDNPYPPLVRITGFSVLNGSRTLGPSDHAITLSQRDSGFTLEFAALHYADPMSNRYAYRLEGFDDSWVSTDAAKRFASYTNLDPGHYIFQVRASNKDGVWSEKPAALDITITPPLWKTWWFRTVALLLALAAAYALYWLRIRVLVQQKGSLEREVGVRTAELVLQKDAAERRKLEVEQQKEVVEQAHRNIALLSDIGRRLTANLDSDAIMASLHAHVHQLMDAGIFGIALVRPESGVAEYGFAIVDGRRRTPSGADSADPVAARCVDSGREVLIDNFAAEGASWLGIDGDPEAVALATLPSAELPKPARRALLYVPIMVSSRVLGVVTVQSFERGAYRRIHLDMLRTLAAYAGIAFDNADAYRRLKEAQAQLAAREKLASLGSLVAGVAHELNTPIGNSLLIASTLKEKSDAMVARFEAASLRRSDLAAWIAESQEASSLIMRSLHNAAELVNSFKQVAVDQASAQQRRFDLAQACHEIVATLMNQVRLAGHTLELRVPDGIVMDSFPGPLGQVIINFVNNALLHAYDQPGGHMLLTAAALEGGRARIEFHDDGRGIEAQHLARIFDPFYTTRMGRGGTGLGLNIAYNIATSLLGGTIRVESTPGQGAVFILELPLTTITRTS